MTRMPKSDAVANCWEQYRATILDVMEGEPLDPQAINFARASFYFGNLAMLGVLETVAESGSPAAIAAALEGLRQEVEGFLSAQAMPLN